MCGRHLSDGTGAIASPAFRMLRKSGGGPLGGRTAAGLLPFRVDCFTGVWTGTSWNVYIQETGNFCVRFGAESLARLRNRTRVPAHEPPRNRTPEFWPADCVRAAHQRVTGADRGH
jgi:hypothetical protein